MGIIMKTVEDSENKISSLEKGVEGILGPFKNFIKDQTTTSVILVAFTAVALLIANSPYSEFYEKFLHMPLALSLGDSAFELSVRHWINDGLMALFFFMLGVEMKREMLTGEISNRERFIPIAFAAAGGMVLPAFIFFLFNSGTSYQPGWGITMATDAAFAIGILAFLGKRVPAGAFIFLTALAILDDLGAILVIALFYSDSISYEYLAFGFLILLVLGLFNIIGIRKPSVYLLMGILLWIAMLNSGVHATVTGVLVAALVPARPKRDPGWFVDKASELMSKFKKLEAKREVNAPILGEPRQHEVVEEIQGAAEKASAPLRLWEGSIEHPVALFVLPIFALANAGVAVNMEVISQQWSSTLTLGIFFGLVLGKSVGIAFFTWVALKLSFGKLPEGLSMKHVIGLGLLGGVGFTMSIFIAGLSFDGTSEAINTAKMAILVSSFVAGLSGYLWLRFVTDSD